jgi:hypothetical protein
MKHFLYSTLILLSINNSFAKNDDNGWSSSGGEYIVTQNNPWFMGTDPVKWCIDYGGEDKFSLPLNLAKIEVQKGLEVIINQIKSVNAHPSDMHYPSGHNGQFIRKCSSSNCDNAWEEGDGKYLSDSFVFINNCDEADLEIILGNFENQKIKKLISEIGEIKFQRTAGLATRTEYSESDIRGKGFIYIAADKGTLQYKGARNLKFQNSTIWNTYENLSKNAPFPKDKLKIKNNYMTEIYPSLLLKDFTMGNLQAVISHEFGHVIGFKHNENHNIMDEDYPAKQISQGLTFKGSYLRDSIIISKGLIESDFDRTIGFEWNTNRVSNSDKEDMPNQFPLIAKLLLDTPKEYEDMDGPGIPVIFSFNFSSDASGNVDQSLNLVTLDRKNFGYKIYNTYKTEETYPCSSPVEAEAINLRITSEVKDTIGISFDEISKKWSQSPNSSEGTSNNTIRLLRLDNTFKCGKIYMSKLNKNKYINYKLNYNYINHTSTIEFSENDKSESISLWLNESDIFSQKGAPLPRPTIYNFID